MVDLPRPSPGPEDVVLRTFEIGINGTDREINEGIYGTPPDGSSYLVLGHEAVGDVVEVGDEVEEMRPGYCVVPTVRRPDGCPNSLAGESDMCLWGDYREHGIHRLHGFASDYALSHAGFMLRIPKKLQTTAVLLEPLSIGEKAFSQAMAIQGRMVWEPRKALVVGAGPLGLLTALVLRLRDLEVWVAATRTSKSIKARIAADIGCHYVNARRDPISEIQGNFDLVIEATGKVKPATEAAGKLDRNGVMCLLGNYRHEGSWPGLHRSLYDMVLGNKLVFGSVNSNLQHFRKGLSDMTEIRRRYPGILERMITQRLSPEEYARAFEPDRENIKT